MAQDLLFSVADGVATVTLDRAERLNALSPGMVEGMLEAFARAERDPAIRCLVIRGAGEHFMAGGDIRSFEAALRQPPDQRARHFESLIHDVHQAILMLRRMPKPVLASVHGACAGFGLSLVMACDLAIAAEDAVFTLAYVNIATSPDGSSTFFLPRLVGLRRAMEIALLGDRFDAGRAAGLGLVNFVVPRAALAEETAKLAGRLAAGPTRAIGNTKALLNGAFDRTLETQLHAEALSFVDCAGTEDMREGIDAFLQKRKPAFKGS